MDCCSDISNYGAYVSLKNVKLLAGTALRDIKHYFRSSIVLLAQYKHPKKVAREAFMGMMWLACHISLVAPGYVRANQTLGDLWRSGKKSPSRVQVTYWNSSVSGDLSHF